jgi:hypothetical protein
VTIEEIWIIGVRRREDESPDPAGSDPRAIEFK